MFAIGIADTVAVAARAIEPARRERKKIARGQAEIDQRDILQVIELLQVG